MPAIVPTTLLLIASNVFMTFAWYAHLKNMNHRPWYVAAFASWGIALFEYLLQVPANRIGYTQLSLGQLKILQEVITLAVFVPFAAFYMQQAGEARLSVGGLVYARRGLLHLPVAEHDMKTSLTDPDTVIHAQVVEAREGRLPRVVTRLYSGWVVFGRAAVRARLLPAAARSGGAFAQRARREGALAVHDGHEPRRRCVAEGLRRRCASTTRFSATSIRRCTRTSCRAMPTSRPRCAPRIPGPTTGAPRRSSIAPAYGELARRPAPRARSHGRDEADALRSRRERALTGALRRSAA